MTHIAHNEHGLKFHCARPAGHTERCVDRHQAIGTLLTRLARSRDVLEGVGLALDETRVRFAIAFPPEGR